MVVSRQQYRPGRLYYDKSTSQLWVRCVDGWALLNGVSIPGRKHGSVDDFVHGFHIAAEGATPAFVYVSEEERVVAPPSVDPAVVVDDAGGSGSGSGSSGSGSGIGSGSGSSFAGGPAPGTPPSIAALIGGSSKK